MNFESKFKELRHKFEKKTDRFPEKNYGFKQNRIIDA